MSCATCVPASPPASAVDLDLDVVEMLVDDSHLIISIRACKACRQRFVWWMTEIIDWAEGNDRATRTILPVSDDEAAVFLAQGEALDHEAVDRIARGRTFLRYTDGAGFYATGTIRLHHD